MYNCLIEIARETFIDLKFNRAVSETYVTCDVLDRGTGEMLGCGTDTTLVMKGMKYLSLIHI